MVAKNRPAFLELEQGGMNVEELWHLTGFARCADCDYLIHTDTLAALPEHHCTQRQAHRRAADTPDCERCDGSGLDPDRYTEQRGEDGQIRHHAETCIECQPEDDETQPDVTTT